MVRLLILPESIIVVSFVVMTSFFLVVVNMLEVLCILNNCDKIDVLDNIRILIYSSVADYARWSYSTSVFGIFFDDDYPVVISSIYVCSTQ